MSKIINYSLNEDFYDSSRHLNYLNFFLIGLIIYSTAYIIKGNHLLSQKMGDMLQLAATIGLLTCSAFLIKFKIKNKYLAFFFSVYIFWAVAVILRGISLHLTDLIGSLLNGNYGILLYFAPLILLFPKSITFYKRMFDAMIILGLIFLTCTVLFRHELMDRSAATKDSIEYLSRTLAMPCGFLLLTYKYHSKTRILFALVVMVLSLLFSIYKARRGLSITLISISILAYLIFIINARKKVLAVYLSALILISGALYASSIYNINNNKLLSMMADRGDEDTRTGVELYFYNDMKTKDWIIGRGINGKYYCPIFSDEDVSDYRNLMETGYLQIILKGGLIRLILFLLIAVSAIFLGLFSSKNMLAKASALWIMVAIISLYPATVESFTLQYLLVWVSIGVCYSKQLRMMPDLLIQEKLKNISGFNLRVKRFGIL